MPKDDDRVFDVTRPHHVAPSPNSRPIIVGHHPMMADPMVNSRPPAPMPMPTPSPQPMAPPPPPAPAGPKPITVHMADDEETVLPPPPTVHHMHHPDPGPPMPPPLVAEHPESVAASATPAEPEVHDQADAPVSVEPVVAPVTPPGDLNLATVDELIGHGHHPHHHPAQDAPAAVEPDQAPMAKKGSKLPWIILGLLVLLIAAYLAIDSGLISTSINLPFHIFTK